MKKLIGAAIAACLLSMFMAGCMVEDNDTPGTSSTTIKDTKTVDVPATPGTDVKTSTTTTTTG